MYESFYINYAILTDEPDVCPWFTYHPKTVYIIMRLDDINAIVTILKLHHTGKLIISRIEGLPC